MGSTSNPSETPQVPPQDTNTSNMGFELPTQSSSSEESSVSTEDDYSSEDERKPSNGTTNDENENSNVGEILRQDNYRQEDERICMQSNQELFDTAFGNESNSHLHHQQQQPCIDLVDSDDDNEHPPTQYDRQHHMHHGSGQTFENENSPRSPTTRKSPKFNVAARNFLYNKPWTNTNHRQDEQEDVIQFEDDDRKLPARPRRVTQDHTNQLSNLNTYSGNRNEYGGTAAGANHLQPSQSSNHQDLSSQEHTRHRSTGMNPIERPWPVVRSRRMRDPTSSNVSLAASVVTRNTNRGCNDGVNSARASQDHRQNGGNIGDIRTFVTRRPALAFETRNRAKTIEKVRASRHDIQGHTNVAVVNHPPAARGRPSSRSTSRTNARGEQPEDVIEVFDDEEVPAKRPARARKTTAAKKAKPRRKRTYTRKTKGRKTGGRKRTRKAAGGRGRRYGNKKTTKSNDDTGVWGSTSGGWSSERPVHREDPAFRNVGAEITF